ncbi:MAG: aminotransferase class IV [Phycisphaerales bacterium]
MSSVFLDGEFVSRDGARVSAFDAGLQHGVGLFETMLGVREGAGVRGILVREHVERLAFSARELGLSTTLKVEALVEAVRRTVERAVDDSRGVSCGGSDGVSAWRVRLTITGGDLNLLERGEGVGREHQPTVLIAATPATVYPEAMFERGVSVVLADWRVNPLDAMAGHKTLSYWSRLRELQRAAASGAGEALVFQVTNHLSGGCVSNVFCVRDGVLLTPIARGEEGFGDGTRQAGGGGAVLPSPVLPGITREWVIQQAEAMGMTLERRMLSIDDVLSSDEVFLTNSSWGVLPVVGVERERIGGGVVGEVTRGLVGGWRGFVRGGHEGG